MATAIDQQIGALLAALPKLQNAFEPIAGKRAGAQLAAHERVREVASTKGRITIQPVHLSVSAQFAVLRCCSTSVSCQASVAGRHLCPRQMVERTL